MVARKARGPDPRTLRRAMSVLGPEAWPVASTRVKEAEHA